MPQGTAIGKMTARLPISGNYTAKQRKGHLGSTGHNPGHHTNQRNVKRTMGGMRNAAPHRGKHRGRKSRRGRRY